MTYDEYIFTASEITQLERLLSAMTGEESAIERMGLERRLAKARKRISGIAPPPPPVYDDGGTEPAAALRLAGIGPNGGGERLE